MKKILGTIIIASFCLTSYSQDSTKKKVETKTKKTTKKVQNKAKTVSKNLDNKTDSIVKKVYPQAHKVPQ